MKEGRKEGRKEERKEERKKGRKRQDLTVTLTDPPLGVNFKAFDIRFLTT